jgi:hypothetical protein
MLVGAVKVPLDNATLPPTVKDDPPVNVHAPNCE